MAGLDVNQILAGGVIGTAVTGAVALAGHLLSRLTTVDTSKIEDRSKFTRDLMEQVEKLYEENGELRHAAVASQRRELSFIRFMSYIGGELRVLGGTIASLFLELLRDEPRKEEMLADVQEMQDCSLRISDILAQEERLTESFQLASKDQREEFKTK